MNGRLPALSVFLGALLGPASSAAQGGPALVVVDRDDDDADGVPDGEQARVPSSPELLALRAPRGASQAPAAIPDGLRLLVDGSPVQPGSAIPAGARRVELQAVRAGRSEIALFGRTLPISAFEVRAIDGAGTRIDMARSHASLQRTPPDRLGDDPFGNLDDPDAIRLLVIGAADDLPLTVDVHSAAPSGRAIDRLPSVPLGHVACPPDVPAGLVCGSTRPLRIVADDIDRNHPMIADRSVKGEVGGALVVALPDGPKLQMIRIAGPRSSPLGPLGRTRARLRILMVRPRAGGPPPMGGDDSGALAIARAEVERANALWGACGVSFGPPEELDISFVDPPRPHLLAIGCDHGLPASGGAIRVRVDGHEVTASIRPRMRPDAAARAVAAAIGAAGFSVRLSDNPAIGAGAFGTTDVLVRRPGGAPAAIEPPASGALSTDPTLTACIGAVELEDGLQHFSDTDAIAGTVEERALIKAFDDGDPATIDVVMVPSFAGGGRIGESFIFADGGAIRNTIIEDRAGLRADRASFALSHELGHVLLDEPGHPDDFGVDTPTRLMDADAANSSAYGPRRLTVDECARAIRQSGAAEPRLGRQSGAAEQRPGRQSGASEQRPGRQNGASEQRLGKQSGAAEQRPGRQSGAADPRLGKQSGAADPRPGEPPPRGAQGDRAGDVAASPPGAPGFRPSGPVPLLAPWPLAPLGRER
ncbi:hypothetical protein WMF26_25460 [Sorangium sp. So ce185]|uniref:hypothetical protein n=1 Tax=Sorangium sp. So ce185 TaxID=3133287 RepID=UPI003F5E778F